MLEKMKTADVTTGQIYSQNFVKENKKIWAQNEGLE